jgi:acetoin utilization protein AcuB
VITDPKVHALMQRDVHTVSPDAPLAEVARTMAARGFHHVPVVDGTRVVGIVSAQDVAKASLERWVPDRETNEAWLAGVPVRDAMTPLPEVLHPSDPVRVAAERLGDGAFHALPVLDPQTHALVGIVTTTDLVRFLHDQLRG